MKFDLAKVNAARAAKGYPVLTNAQAVHAISEVMPKTPSESRDRDPEVFLIALPEPPPLKK